MRAEISSTWSYKYIFCYTVDGCLCPKDAFERPGPGSVIQQKAVGLFLNKHAQQILYINNRTLLYLLLPVAYKFKFLTGTTLKSMPMHAHTNTRVCTHQPTHTFLFGPSLLRCSETSCLTIYCYIWVWAAQFTQSWYRKSRKWRTQIMAQCFSPLLLLPRNTQN